MKPVLHRYKDTESVIRAMDGYTPGDSWVPLFEAPATAPAWQDAPTEPGMWACLYMGELSTAIFNAYEIEHFDRDEMVGCRWRFIPEDKQ